MIILGRSRLCGQESGRRSIELANNSCSTGGPHFSGVGANEVLESPEFLIYDLCLTCEADEPDVYANYA